MSKTWRRTSLASLVLAICIVGLAFFLAPKYFATSATTEKVRIGVATWIGYGAMYIAQERGFFRGVDVDIRRIDDTSVYNSAMLRGEIDGFCNTLDSFVVAAAGGVQGVVVYLFDESAGADGVAVRAAINSLAELRGKRVAAQTGWPGHFFLLYLMGAAGIGPNEYTHVNLDSDKAGAALMSGDLDGAVTWEPWLTQVREAGKGKVLISTREHPGIIVDSLIVNRQVADERRKAVQAVVAGLMEAVEFWKTNPTQANEIVAKNFGLKAEEVANMITGVHYLTREDNRSYLEKGARADQTLSLAVKIWRAAGVMSNAPELSGTVTNEFVK